MVSEASSILKNRFKFSDIGSLLKETYRSWMAEDPFQLSAVVAYYAILSLPALMVMIIHGVGAVWGRDIVAGRLNDEFSSTLGPDAAQAIQDMVSNSLNDDQNLFATILGIAVLIYGATGVFYQLQQTLNKFWRIKTSPDAGWKRLVLDRAQSFGFILAVGFLLLISLMLTSAISVMEDYIEIMLSDLSFYIIYVINTVLSLALVTGLFAMMFKFLPDARISWRTVWIGAFITALMFTIGKAALAFYFGQADPGSAYGAAGSVILILLWVSYSSLILFFGAKFTYVYSQRYGHGVEPLGHAVRID